MNLIAADGVRSSVLFELCFYYFQFISYGGF